MQSPIIALCKHFLNHGRCTKPQKKKIGHVEDDEDNNEQKKNINELQLNLSTGKKKT